MSFRRRPLHTCGVSFVDMAHNVCKRACEFDGPIGYVTNKLSSLASPAFPLLCALQHLLLSIVLFLDDRILSYQNRVEALFAPSSYAFDIIDEMVEMVEALPAKFDKVLDELPALVHKVPLLDWALVQAVSWLDFWLFVLAYLCGKEVPVERDIVIDIKCDDQNNDNESETASTSCSEIVSPRLLKGTYKEVLEKGTKESAQERLSNCEDAVILKRSDREEEEQESTQGCGGDGETTHTGVRMMEKSIREAEKHSNEEDGKGAGSGSKMGSDNTDKEDPILSLFESVWLMNPNNKR